MNGFIRFVGGSLHNQHRDIADWIPAIENPVVVARLDKLTFTANSQADRTFSGANGTLSMVETYRLARFVSTSATFYEYLLDPQDKQVERNLPRFDLPATILGYPVVLMPLKF